MKRYLLLFVIFFITALLENSAYADRLGFVRTVVIDAGHGGRDPGALGSRSKEKDLALAISLKVGEYINEHLPDVKVIYTRQEDVFVPLHERASIANKNNADLFISIHCNASPSPRAIGTETFVMGLDKSKANLEVAKLENAAILYEEDYIETYDGYDPHSPESLIIFALYQNAHLNQSIDIASRVQGQFRERARRVDRGVKQGPFIVLWRVTMPSVLIEAGFINNPKEEEYLMSESGQSHIASAIFRAFREYKEDQDQLAMLAQQYIENNNTGENTQFSDDELNIQKAEQENDISVAKESHGQVLFKVQFAATSEKKALNSPDFDELLDVNYYFHDGLYKYTVGSVQTLKEAVEIQSQMQAVGYRDAFIVAFYNDERISATEAMKLIQDSN